MKRALMLPIALLCFAQSPAQDGPAPGLDSADVATPQATVQALYRVISGPAGTRDWARFRLLCTPNCQFNAVAQDKEGNSVVRLGDREAYIKGATVFFAQSGFYETEVSHKVERYANIAHVFSTYESRTEESGKPFARGINSIQLVYDEGRWWVSNVLWNTESHQFPIPPRYLD